MKVIISLVIICTSCFSYGQEEKVDPKISLGIHSGASLLLFKSYGKSKHAYNPSYGIVMDIAIKKRFGIHINIMHTRLYTFLLSDSRSILYSGSHISQIVYEDIYEQRNGTTFKLGIYFQLANPNQLIKNKVFRGAFLKMGIHNSFFRTSESTNYRYNEKVELIKKTTLLYDNRPIVTFHGIFIGLTFPFTIFKNIQVVPQFYLCYSKGEDWSRITAFSPSICLLYNFRKKHDNN